MLHPFKLKQFVFRQYGFKRPSEPDDTAGKRWHDLQQRQPNKLICVIGVCLLLNSISYDAIAQADVEEEARVSYDWDHFRSGCEEDPPPEGHEKQCFLNNIELVDVDASSQEVKRHFRLYTSDDLQIDEPNKTPNQWIEHAILAIHGTTAPLEFLFSATMDNCFKGNTVNPQTRWIVSEADIPPDWPNAGNDDDWNNHIRNKIIELEHNGNYFFYKVLNNPTPVGPINAKYYTIEVELLDDNPEGDFPSNGINPLPQPTIAAGDSLITRFLTGSFTSINAKSLFNTYLDTTIRETTGTDDLGMATSETNDFRTLVATVNFAKRADKKLVEKSHLPPNYHHCIGAENGEDRKFCVKFSSDWRSGGYANFCDVDCEKYNKIHTSITTIDKAVKALTNKERFPNLKSLVIQGHSAGGQFLNRYAILGKGEEASDNPNVSIRYISTSGGELMFPGSSRIFHNDFDNTVEPGTYNPFYLENNGNTWRPLDIADDYYWNTDSQDANFNEYDKNFVKSRTGMCDDTDPDKCKSRYSTAHDGADLYGEYDKVIQRLKKRDIVYYAGGKEVCEEGDGHSLSIDLLSQGNNHVYRSYSYYLHNNNLFGGDDNHNTFFVYSPNGQHSTNGFIKHYLAKQHMFTPSELFDCNESTDESFEICQNNDTEANTRYWSDVVIKNVSYLTGGKHISNEGQKVILSSQGGSEVIIEPVVNSDSPIVISVKKPSTEELKTLDRNTGDVIDWITTDQHCYYPTQNDIDRLLPVGPVWREYTHYPAGTTVVFENVEYTCIMTHDSTPSDDPGTGSPYWGPKTPGGDWRTNVIYEVGDIATFDGLEFMCIKHHVSVLGHEPQIPSEFWCLPPNAGNTDQWENCVHYFIGDTVFYEGNQFECIAEHVSYPSVEPPDAPELWFDISDVSWEEDTFYEIGDRVFYEGVEYICVQSHTSLSGWTPLTVQSLWNVFPHPGDPWMARVSYATDEIVWFEGNNYQCLSGHVSQEDWEPDNTPTLWLAL